MYEGTATEIINRAHRASPAPRREEHGHEDEYKDEALAGINVRLVGLSQRIEECHAAIRALRSAINALHADVRMIVPRY